MTDPVDNVARAIAEVWTSENKKADLSQAASLFVPSAQAARRAVVAEMREPSAAMHLAALRTAVQENNGVEWWKAMLHAYAKERGLD